MVKYLRYMALFVLIVANAAFSREIHYGSETEAVTIAYGGPTIFRFNEPVKTISRADRFKIAPADDENPNYAVLSVTPRFSEGQDPVTFILADGSVVNVKIITVSKNLPERTNSFYDFKPKEQILEREDRSQEPMMSELDIMKAMLRGDNVNGYKSQPLTREVHTGVPELSAWLVRIYTGAKFNGYVFKVQNNSLKKEYVVDLENLTLGQPNTALLSQVDQKVLGVKDSKENTTYLRIVAKPTSVYYNVNLPVAPIIKE